MDLPKVLTEAVKLETLLANHYRGQAGAARDPILERVLGLLGEESMLHAIKLRFLCKSDFEVSGSFAPAMDRLALIEERLGELLLQTNPDIMVLKCTRLEEELGDFYRDLCEFCEEIGEHSIGSFLRSIAADEDYHLSLLASARASLRRPRSCGEET